MLKRPIFIKVKNFVENRGYTIQQIQDVTPLQVKYLFNLTEKEYEQYCAYAPGIKVILIGRIQEKTDKRTVADMKTQIHLWLSDRFPDYEVEKDFKDSAHRKIIFHLDGREE